MWGLGQTAHVAPRGPEGSGQCHWSRSGPSAPGLHAGLLQLQDPACLQSGENPLLFQTISRDTSQRRLTWCAVFVQLSDVRNTDLCQCSRVALVHGKVINSNQASEAAEE